MGTKKKLPLSFFEKPRKNAPKNSLNDVEPIKWSKEVLEEKKQILVTIPKEIIK